MKKPDFSKIKVATKKDWIIFWVFAVLATYAAAGFIDDRIEQSLRAFVSPWLWEGNEPHSYGRMMVAAVIMALEVEVVCFLKRKRAWVKLSVLAVGVLVPAALVGMYFFNCHLIVSVLWNEEPSHLYVTWKDPEDNRAQTYYPTPEEREELLKFCRNLTVVSDKELQEEFKTWSRESRSFFRQDSISINFPEKYGHHYSLNLYVWGDYFYFFKGHGRGNENVITLFEDNGLIQYMETLRQGLSEEQLFSH